MLQGMVHVSYTRSQLGMLVVRVIWATQCSGAHLRVKQTYGLAEVISQAKLILLNVSLSQFLTLLQPGVSLLKSQWNLMLFTFTLITWVHSLYFDSYRVYHGLKVCFTAAFYIKIQPNLCLHRWMLYASAECQSSFTPLCWPLLEVFWRSQTCHMTQDKQLQISPSVYPKVWMCVPFMWRSEQETVQECLHPVKQLKLVSISLKN